MFGGLVSLGGLKAPCPPYFEVQDLKKTWFRGFWDTRGGGAGPGVPGIWGVWPGILGRLPGIFAGFSGYFQRSSRYFWRFAGYFWHIFPNSPYFEVQELKKTCFTGIWNIFMGVVLGIRLGFYTNNKRNTVRVRAYSPRVRVRVPRLHIPW